MKHLYNKLLFIVTFCTFIITSCSFLDMVPEDDIETLETIFESNVKARSWFKDCYVPLNYMFSDWSNNVSLLASDEYAASELMYDGDVFPALDILSGYDSKAMPADNKWTWNGFYGAIRKINTFVNRVDGVYDMLEEDKKMMKAELMVLKAHYYFELMRRYGPIVLIDKNMDVTMTDDEMRLPRSPIDTVVAEICRLIDEARPNLLKLKTKDISRYCYHSLESGMMLKAQALFWAASPIFNGNISYANFKNYKGEQLVNTSYNREKWVEASEAIKEAIEVINDGGLKIVDDVATSLNGLQKTMYVIERSNLAPAYVNDEAVFFVRPPSPSAGQTSILGYILPRIALVGDETTHPLYSPSHLGVLGASMKMVETYYTENGLPINMDASWIGKGDARYKMGIVVNKLKYKGVVPDDQNVLNLHLDREPRFYAHIATDRTYWRRGPSAKDNVVVKAYRGERFGTTYQTIQSSNYQNISGYWIKKNLDSDIRTQNYSADASKVEYGHMVMRVSELYLMLAESLNEAAESPTQEVYDAINKIRSRAGIPNVEVSWENYSLNKSYHKTKNGMRNIIRQEWNIEFAFEGTRYWNLRRWLTAAVEINEPIKGWNILGSNAEQFYNNFNGPKVIWTKNTFDPVRGYLHPIHNDVIFESGITQNPGW